MHCMRIPFNGFLVYGSYFEDLEIAMIYFIVLSIFIYFVFMALINLVPEQVTSYRLFLTVSVNNSSYHHLMVKN